MSAHLENDTEGTSPTGFHAQRIAGCLLGGAVGDALGVSVKSMSLREIRYSFGPAGIRNPVLENGVAPVSDCTQLAIFTADGLLRAIVCDEHKVRQNPVEIVHQAYLRWMRVHGLTLPENVGELRVNGWLAKRGTLHACRSADDTCLSALGSGRMGSVWTPINDSSGSGAMARVVPIGLVESITECFALGADVAAITHGNPCAYLSAGMFAATIRLLMEGAEIEDALTRSLQLLEAHAGHEKIQAALKRAIRMAKSSIPSPEVVEFIGSGWKAHQSLAVAVYCALVHQDDFPAALRLAANHSGNSSVTASLTGSLLGARLGRDAIPDQWAEHVELRDEIEELSKDLSREFVDADEWFYRYPGW